MFSCSIIITTYNRPDKVNELVTQLLSIAQPLEQIIVVDSSDDDNVLLREHPAIIYIKSTHKNQPYQRYLGFLMASAAYLLFFDDDMELVSFDFLKHIETLIKKENAVGLALHFKDKHLDTTLAAVPKSALFKRSKWLRHFKNWFTGYADLPEGTFGYCGNRGKQPSKLAPTQYVSGGAFVAKRSALFQNFNFQLFDLFEQRMGMGEDALIGYGLHKQGSVLFVPDIYCLHNDQKDSSYSMNVHDYAQRVLFSRLYLSLEKCRMDGNSMFFAKAHYHWYAFWRLMGLLINLGLKRSTNSKFVFIGSWKGWRKACKFRFNFDGSLEQYWKNELANNLKNG